MVEVRAHTEGGDGAVAQIQITGNGHHLRGSSSSQGRGICITRANVSMGSDPPWLLRLA